MSTPTNTTQGIDLDKLEALLNAATPGDWSARRQGVIVGGPMRQYANGSAQSQIAAFSVTFHSDDSDDEPERQQANADFCIAAKNAMPALIALARQQTPATGKMDEAAHGEGWNYDYNLTFRALSEAVQIGPSGAKHISPKAFWGMYGPVLTQQAAPEAPTDNAMTLLRDAARAWNNESGSELDATMERIECFLIDSRAPATHQATPAAPEAPTGYKLVPAKLTPYMRFMANKQVGFSAMYEAAVAAAPASPPKPAASQQAVANSEQQEKVAPPTRGTGSQHDAGVSAWISVDARLPEHGEEDAAHVWASWSGAPGFPCEPRLGEVRYIKSLGWQPNGCQGWDWIVTHWMPLPLPPDKSNTAGAAKGGENKDNSKNVATTAAEDKGD